MNRLKVNCSITDFAPLLKGLDLLFKGLKQSNVDGIELVIGIKSRFSIEYLRRLSKKYDLPIVSVHQPIWSGLGLFLDEGFVQQAIKLNVTAFTFHPLPFISLNHPRMKTYFEKLAKIKVKYNISIGIENMPVNYQSKLFAYLSDPINDTSNLKELSKVASQYGFGLVFDTSHAQSPHPQKEVYFEQIFDQIINIHLSSFIDHKHHLPLDMGNFDTKGFITELKKRSYDRLIDLEVYYPSMYNVFGYDFSHIKDSVEIIKSI